MKMYVLPLWLSLTVLPTAVGSQEVDEQPQLPGQVSPQISADEIYLDVVVVQLDTLDSPSKQEVEDIIDQTSADDLKGMQDTIGQSRQAVLTLASAGLDPSQVVAAGVSEDGVLTLVVQQTA